MKHEPTGYITKDKEWRICKYDSLNKDCQDLVEDLINSSNCSQNWSRELKYQYFTKAVTIAFDSGRDKSSNILTRASNKIRDKVFYLITRLVGYVY